MMTFAEYSTSNTASRTMTDKVKCDDVYLEFAGRLSALNANLVHDATSHFDVFVTCHAVARTLLEERTHL